MGPSNKKEVGGPRFKFGTNKKKAYSIAAGYVRDV